MAKCQHDRERSKCKDCGGGSYCEHQRIRGNCTVCSPEQVFRQYQYKAKQRGLSFSLTLDQFEKLVAEPCQHCGENFEPRGVDRIDSRIGYVQNASVKNCQALCWPCNQLKSCGRQPGQPENEQKHLAHIQKIAAYQEKLRKQKMGPQGPSLPASPHAPTLPANENDGVLRATGRGVEL